MAEVSLTINGEKISCASGTSILDAALAHGIRIPNLCHHPDLEPFGACRLCLVEEEASGRIMASCVTPAAGDMSILTQSPRVVNHRRNIVRLMMAEHPESCIVCSKGNRCRLRQLAAELGIGETRLYPMPNYLSLEEANPFIIRDLSKCILCGKCIRADHELIVAGAIDYNLRGFGSRPATVHERGLEHSTCTFCGTCVSLCPTGALSMKNTRYVGTPEREGHSVCGFCGVGCSLSLGAAGDRVIEANPSHLEGTANGSTLCVRGHFAHDFLNSAERLESPMIMRDGDLQVAEWDEALAHVAERLLHIKKTDGPQSIGLFGSSKCSNEENYLFQKLARVFIGTNNIDSGAYSAGRPVLDRIQERTGGGERLRPLASLEKADCIFVLGSDPCNSVPVVSYHIKRAARKGVPLIVADPVKTELVPFSSVWLRLTPGTDTLLINGLALLLLQDEAYDAPFIERYAEDFETYVSGLSGLDSKDIRERTGVEVNELKRAADILSGGKTAFLVGQGILRQALGTLAMDALVNLCLLTGSLGGERSGIYPMAGENNLNGSWDMGSAPHTLPGRSSLAEGGSRKQWERFWGVKISPDQGLNIVRMIEEAEQGRLKALYVMGENPVRSLPDPDRVKKALERLDLLVVQDILLTETCRSAHVLLPGAAFSEKAGSFTNMEGRIQGFDPVVSPPAEARPDWEILDQLSLGMGCEKAYGSVERIRTEIRGRVSMYEGLDNRSGQAWIRHAGSKDLYSREDGGERVPFTPVKFFPKEGEDQGYKLTAVIGSDRFHMGCGTRTGSSERIRAFGLGDEAGISASLAADMKLEEGDGVRIVSPHGAVERTFRLDRDLPPGIVRIWAARHDNDVMRLIPLTTLEEGGLQGWQTVRVRIEKA